MSAGDGEETSTESETRSIAALETPYMARTEAAREMTVCPWLSHVIAGVIGTCVMSDPFIAVDVRSVRMSQLYPRNAAGRELGVRERRVQEQDREPQDDGWKLPLCSSPVLGEP